MTIKRLHSEREACHTFVDATEEFDAQSEPPYPQVSLKFDSANLDK